MKEKLARFRLVERTDGNDCKEWVIQELTYIIPIINLWPYYRDVDAKDYRYADIFRRGEYLPTIHHFDPAYGHSMFNNFLRDVKKVEQSKIITEKVLRASDGR